MTLYAESSAVLSWLLGEETGAAVREALANAEQVAASDLTLVECSRVLIRARALGEATEVQTTDRLSILSAAAMHWHILRVGGEVVDRAQRPFPNEPIRTLDALHLASALVARGSLPGLQVLSLDARLRGSAAQLGFDLQPAEMRETLI